MIMLHPHVNGTRRLTEKVSGYAVVGQPKPFLPGPEISGEESQRKSESIVYQFVKITK
jgi:hypothetical protein